MFRFALAALIASAAAAEADEWRASPLNQDTVVFASLDWVAPDGLPDGFMAKAAGDIAAAWYVAPTRRYGHGILGDAIEAGGLRVTTADGVELTYDLPTHLLGIGLKGKYRGQKQMWFAYRFEGDESEIAINPPPDDHDPEFDDWRWEDMAKLPELIVDFKVDIYRQVVARFSHLAG